MAGKGRRGRARGQAMVELALILPLLLVLGISVLDYGYYLEHVNNIATIVRDGARYAGEHSTSSTQVAWSGAVYCADPISRSGGGYSCPKPGTSGGGDPSNTVEGVIQLEAESLTVPEGGLPLDNVDCEWSGGVPTPDQSQASLPGSFPTDSGATESQPWSCMTIAYYSSSDGSYSKSSLCLAGYWSADTSSSQGAWEEAGGGCGASAPVSGDVVQVTLVYDWTHVAPGPDFTVLNSVFGLHVRIRATYFFVVSG